MSFWTYVHGAIEVDTFGSTDAQSMYIAQTVVDHLPLITGSEGPVNCYLNLVKGHNTSSNVDEFYRFSNLARYKTLYGRFETQSHVMITLEGSLRDRMFKQTLRETAVFLNRLSSRLEVFGLSVGVSDDDNHRYFFHDPECFMCRDIQDQVVNLWKRLQFHD